MLQENAKAMKTGSGTPVAQVEEERTCTMERRRATQVVALRLAAAAQAAATQAAAVLAVLEVEEEEEQEQEQGVRHLLPLLPPTKSTLSWNA